MLVSTDPSELCRASRLGVLRLLLTKCVSRQRYYRLKELRKTARHLQRWDAYSSSGYRLSPPRRGGNVFKHSGNAGDLIYALPTVRELSDGPAHLRLALDQPIRARELAGPGAVMLNRATYERLVPLLLEQDYIRSVAVHAGEAVSHDLDVFRDSPLPLDRTNICRWYFYFTGVTADLSRAWLQVEPATGFGNSIVIARSPRYRNWSLDHRFLRDYPNLVFVGLEAEYRDFKAHVPQAEWVQVADFLELARIIAGARFFIGNQSFPFALAEALKVPRVLEACPTTPNVVPAGPHAYDAFFQRQFESVVARLAELRPSLPERPGTHRARPAQLELARS